MSANKKVETKRLERIQGLEDEKAVPLLIAERLLKVLALVFGLLPPELWRVAGFPEDLPASSCMHRSSGFVSAPVAVASPAQGAQPRSGVEGDAAGGDAPSSSAAPLDSGPLHKLMSLFWPVFFAIEERVAELTPSLLMGKSVQLFAEALGAPLLGGAPELGFGVADAEAISSARQAEMVSNLAELNAELAAAFLALIGEREREDGWDDARFGSVVFSEEECRNGVRVAHCNVLGKMSDALAFFGDDASVVWTLVRDAEALDKQKKKESQIPRVAEAPEPSILRVARAVRRALTRRVKVGGGGNDGGGDGGEISIVALFEKGASYLEPDKHFASPKAAVDKLVELTKGLNVRCRLTEEHLRLVTSSPPELTKRFFDVFLSTALSRQLLYWICDELGPPLGPTGLGVETFLSILSLAPLEACGVPLALVILREQLLSSSDVVSLVEKDAVAEEITNAIFPHLTVASQKADENELKAVTGAVRFLGRGVLAPGGHGRSFDDAAAWGLFFPRYFSAVDERGLTKLETWLAKRVALNASLLPLTYIQSVIGIRTRSLLFVPAGQRLEMSREVGTLRAASGEPAGPAPKKARSYDAGASSSSWTVSASGGGGAGGSGSGGGGGAEGAGGEGGGLRRATAIVAGPELLEEEHERIRNFTFHRSNVSPQKVFFSTPGASRCGDTTCLVLECWQAVFGKPDGAGGRLGHYVGPDDGDKADPRPVGVAFLDEGTAGVRADGQSYTSAWSLPTGHLCGGNGLVSTFAVNCPVSARSFFFSFFCFFFFLVVFPFSTPEVGKPICPFSSVVLSLPLKEPPDKSIDTHSLPSLSHSKNSQLI